LGVRTRMPAWGACLHASRHAAADRHTGMRVCQTVCLITLINYLHPLRVQRHLPPWRLATGLTWLAGGARLAHGAGPRDVAHNVGVGASRAVNPHASRAARAGGAWRALLLLEHSAGGGEGGVATGHGRKLRVGGQRGALGAAVAGGLHLQGGGAGLGAGGVVRVAEGEYQVASRGTGEQLGPISPWESLQLVRSAVGPAACEQRRMGVRSKMRRMSGRAVVGWGADKMHRVALALPCSALPTSPTLPTLPCPALPTPSPAPRTRQ